MIRILKHAEKVEKKLASESVLHRSMSPKLPLATTLSNTGKILSETRVVVSKESEATKELPREVRPPTLSLSLKPKHFEPKEVIVEPKKIEKKPELFSERLGPPNQVRFCDAKAPPIDKVDEMKRKILAKKAAERLTTEAKPFLKRASSSPMHQESSSGKKRYLVTKTFADGSKEKCYLEDDDPKVLSTLRQSSHLSSNSSIQGKSKDVFNRLGEVAPSSLNSDRSEQQKSIKSRLSLPTTSSRTSSSYSSTYKSPRSDGLPIAKARNRNSLPTSSEVRPKSLKDRLGPKKERTPIKF